MEEIFTTYNVVILAIVLGLTQFAKGFIYTRWGKFGVQAFAFVVALIAVGIYQYSQYNEIFASILKQALTFLASAIAIYEVLLSKFDFIKSSREKAS